MSEPLCIFETLHGSRAYGLAREGSDTDRKGVIVGPPAWYFGVEPGPEQIELSPDHVRWELRKLLRLASASNPTVIEVLFAHPDDHEVVHPLGQRLLDARPAMLSKQVADTFAGYARSQLARIERHRRWLLSPPAAKPEREDFGLPKARSIPKDQLGAAEAMLSREGDDAALTHEMLPKAFLKLLDGERRYRGAQKEWSQHQQWLKNRNPKRAALEAAHGYDTKHAMHLIRLTTMAAEILETGEVRVRRDDRDAMLAIRDGAYDYDALIAESDSLSARVKAARGASSLPDKPDTERLAALCVELVAEALR